MEPETTDSAVVVGDKRPPPEEDADVAVLRRKKKGRYLKEVAEMALVMAAMLEVRGGRGPSGAEREMMAEARRKLAVVCEGFEPKEVFPVGAFGSLIEDLGLDRLREQRVGFRPSAKLSIAEKLLVTKRKMQKSEENALHSATHSSHVVETNLSAVAESRGALHATKMFTSDKAKPAPASSGAFHAVSPTVHVSSATSTSLPYQLPASELRKPVVASGLPTSFPGKDLSSSLSRGERHQVRVDQRSNGISYTPQMPANFPGGQARPQNAQPAQLGKTVAHNKLLPGNLVKRTNQTHMTTSRMAAQAAAASRPLINQIASGHQPIMHQHMQRPNYGQTPLINNTHNEISKIVQRVLQPQIPPPPLWNPPSRDYLNKTMTCQMCKLVIVEVDDVLLCDACEKGYHIKCLPTQDLKAIPIGDWHCSNCLVLASTKPLPPKYGRVARSITAPKAAPEKKAVIVRDNANQQRLVANGSNGLQSSPANNMNNSSTLSASNPKARNAREMQDVPAVKCHPANSQNDVANTMVPATVSSSTNSSIERSHEGNLDSELKGVSLPKASETNTKLLDQMQSSRNGLGNDLPVSPCSDVVPHELKRVSPPKSSETNAKVLEPMQTSRIGQNTDLKGSPCNDVVPSKLSDDNHLTVRNCENFDTSTSLLVGSLNVDTKDEGLGVKYSELVEKPDTSNNSHSKPSSDSINIVDWIGDVAQVVDEKTYYPSCCVNGIVYKVDDYALFLCDNKLMPFKIQTMWEDNKSRTKWVAVYQCYFPGDLPDTVGRPCSPESNEVYESNHGCTLMPHLIQGPCEVLHPQKFIQENKRRSHLGSEENGGLQPLFKCRWFYDETKGSFRDVTS